MKVIIHDIENELFNTLFGQTNTHDIQIISNNHSIKKCQGCFGCWVGTPGKCVIKDEYEEMGKILSNADEVILISECFYGGYSPFIKNILDRSISYLLPFFELVKNETHHKKRYSNTFNLSVYFYKNQITKSEKKTANELVKANCINFHVLHYKVLFFDTINQLCKEIEI